MSHRSEERMFVPTEDLNCHSFGYYNNFTDRQWFAWAYQTETRVRLEKLQSSKNGSDSSPEKKKRRKQEEEDSLASDYFLNAYPKPDEPNTVYGSVWERDAAHFLRESAYFLRQLKPQDGSLMPIEIKDPSNSVPSPTNDFDGSMPAPPNFLYFLICLECYIGYDLDCIFGASKTDPRLSKAAIMGGAVVAALSSWRDEYIVSLFHSVGLHEYFENGGAKVNRAQNKRYPMTADLLKKMLQEEYLNRKCHLKKALHEYFLSTGTSDSQSSTYASGDLDIFLDAPCLTKQLYRDLLKKCQNKADIVSNIQSFVGGIGWCHDDLQAFASALFAPLCEHYSCYGGDFVFALTKHGLTSTYCKSAINFGLDLPEEKYWPRNTQLIMLHPSADLVGAITDFDLSVTACAFDGATVRLTPRAALSLVRKVAVVTPFCFEEKRNRKRVLKYVRRGHSPAIIDPSCMKPDQSQCSYTRDITWHTPVIEKPPDASRRCWQWNEPKPSACRDLLEYTSGAYNRAHCCCKLTSERSRWYFIDRFEERSGHALEFFAKLNDWDAEMRKKVGSVPSHVRQACQQCFFQCSLFFLINDRHSFGWESLTETDLSSDVAVSCRGTGGDYFEASGGDYFEASFYSGPVFDSRLVRSRARDCYKTVALLHQQSNAEKLRYLLQHGTAQGYQRRFTYPGYLDHLSFSPGCGPYLSEVFDKAMVTMLASPCRSPIGLNPERFIVQCHGCRMWLLGYEYGSNFCAQCQNSKPSDA